MLEHGRILIVDDDAAVRSEIKRVLGPYHYIFDEASDGMEGMQKASSFQPDLILLDIVMPKIDGLKLFQFLQANSQTQGIPVIIITSSEKDACTYKCLQLGASDFISKPFQDKDLLARVERQLEIKEKLDYLVSEKDALSLMQEMIHTLYEKKSMYELLYTLVVQISEVINIKRCSFVRIREDRKIGIVEASSDSPQVRGLEIDLIKYPEILEVLDTKEILIIDDIGKAEIMIPVRDQLKDIQFQSLVLIPVTEEDKVVGTLLLRTARQKDAFLEREVRFLESIAKAAKPAILNAQLFEALEEKILDASEDKDVLPDSLLRYKNDRKEQSQEKIMASIYQIKEEVRRLKGLQQKIKKPKDPPRRPKKTD